jgi:hypothetical protein
MSDDTAMWIMNILVAAFIATCVVEQIKHFRNPNK